MMYNFIFSLYDYYWNFKEMEKTPSIIWAIVWFLLKFINKKYLFQIFSPKACDIFFIIYIFHMFLCF